jgi:hypothetical protein
MRWIILLVVIIYASYQFEAFKAHQYELEVCRTAMYEAGMPEAARWCGK